VALALTVVLTTGLSVTAAALGTGPDKVHISLLGVQLGQAVVAVAAVHVLAGEYGTGLIRATFTALPRRLDVLAAKAAYLLAGTAAAAVVSVAASVLAGRELLAGYPSPTSAVVLRAAGGAVLYLLAVALLGLGIGAAVRSAAGGSGVVLGLLYVVPVLLSAFLDEDWQRALYRIGPSTAGLSILTTVDVSRLPIGPWAGLAVAAAWAFGAVAIGAVRLRRGDV
jgi:ABC-2 type transport system permease protein